MGNIKKRKFNYKKVGLTSIFLILLIFNIIFYAGLIGYYFFHASIKISWGMINNVLTMGSAVIIFAFVSTRLPQFRNLGDSSIYEMGYLIIIGLLSIIISYFNKSTNTESFFAPYLEMFKVLSLFLIIMILATKTNYFKNLINKKDVTKKNLLYGLITFTILGCLASMYTIPINDSFANVRNLIIMIGGLAGGPFVGIPSGIIAGIYRFGEGGATAFPCSIATVIAGFVGSLIYVFRDKKFLRGFSAVGLMFLYVGFEMLLILVLTPSNISFPYVHNIYLLMLFASVLGMILFLMIIKEANSNEEISYEDLKIRELENTLDEYEDRIDRLEEDVQLLKDKNDLE